MVLAITGCPCGEPVCPGITGPAVLDFGDTEIFADGTDVRSAESVLFDPADYPGLTSVNFRATVSAGVSDPSTYGMAPTFKIVDELGTVYLTVTPTFSLSPGFFYESVVDEAITLDPDTEHTYYIQTSNLTGAYQILVPQLWVFMTASDQAKFQIPLMPATSIDNLGSYFTSSTSYIRPPTSNIDPAIFKKTSGGFSEIDYWQVYVIADPSTKAGLVALFDKTTGLMVAGTELTIATGDGINNAVYSAQFSDTATNFTDGDDFEFRMKRTAGSGTIAINKAAVYVKIGSGDTGYFTAPNLCARTAEVYVRASVSDCEDIYLDRAYQYNTADWPVTAVKYFEGTDQGAYSFYLLDTGTSATPIDPPDNVTFVTFIGGSVTRQRSSSITLIDGHIYSVGASHSPFFDVPAFVIHTISGP